MVTSNNRNLRNSWYFCLSYPIPWE